MRILTAGESHGEKLSVIVEGFPKGVKINKDLINRELLRRMSGPGRGARMNIEQDKVHIISGLRNGVSLGSPICMLVNNKDWKIYVDKDDGLPPISVPRPAHADLAGVLKYNEKDIRNVLERASARETAARVCAGSLCKQFLLNFGIEITSFIVQVGKIKARALYKGIKDIKRMTKNSLLNCPDTATEKKMLQEIEKASVSGDTLGGIIEIVAEGVIPGLGDFAHFDRRLDARLAYYLMSIPAVKGVEIGLGFRYAQLKGSTVHDAIYYNRNKGFFHKTNNSGGIEGGISNGEIIVLRIAMKPIATLKNPLDSVDIVTKRKKKAAVIRSDVCAVVSCGVVGENMVAIALVEAFLDKFGRDSLQEIRSNYNNYLRQIRNF